MASTTSAAPPAATSSDTPGMNNGGGNGPSSPLLFFVALGFGVVFTNLWIIVGVKYCFRYSQRGRHRMVGEDPDGVDLNAMPRQRRRREKKLMTIDEVNERFPLIKYKTWRSTRADQGLPTAGGITNAPSRPASIKNITRESKDEIDLREAEPKTPTASTINEKSSVMEHGQPEQISDNTATASSVDQSTPAKSHITAPEPALVRATTNDEEPDDQIQTSIPPEQLPDPGDTCAICIDTIEDDDDIRGLICGHAFHASCVDPWLTSRRACCPLCKADYYVPKPRPEGAPEDARRNSRGDQLSAAGFTFGSAGRHGNRRGRRGPFVLPGVFRGSPQPGSNQTEPSGQTMVQTDTSAPEITQQNSQSWRQRFTGTRLPSVPALSRIRRGRGHEAGEQPPQAPNPTPAQLEAGRT